MTKLYMNDGNDSVEFDFEDNGRMFITSYNGISEEPDGTPVYLTVEQVKKLRKALKRHLIATGHKEVK